MDKNDSERRGAREGAGCGCPVLAFQKMVEYKAKFSIAFKNGVPKARVVRLKANHVIFLSNEADVLREMRAFLAMLK